MDERYRDSLQRHHSFLMRHILLTDDVIRLLSNEKILPETMIKDIQDGGTKEERNQRLLNALRLRGNKSYKRFRELMFRTGNFFVADLLWDEEDVAGGGLLIEEDEVTGKFSSVLNCLQETQRKKFLHHLDAKIREKALVLSWRERPGDRMESLSSRVIDFNQEKGLRDTIATQEKKMKDLESQLKAEEERRRGVALELSSLQQEVKTLKKEHQNQMDTQSRFQQANINTICRLKNRLSSCKTKAAELVELMTVAMEGEKGMTEKRKKTVVAGTDDDDDDDDEEEDVKMASLENTVKELLEQFSLEKGQSRQGRQQREEVLKLLNRGVHTKESLVTIVKDILRHEQKHRAVVMRDIQRLNDAMRQVVPSSSLAPPTPVAVAQTGMNATPPLDPATLDTKHFKNQLAMLRVEAEHIQKRFQWKDSETTSLRQELFALKQRFHDYKIINPASRPAHHSHPSLCASCGKSTASQTNGLPPTDSPMTSGQFSSSSAALTDGGGLSQENLHTGMEDSMPTGYQSRRGSIGKSDMDKTVINVEDYLQVEDFSDFQTDTKKNPTPAAGERMEREENHMAMRKQFSTKRAGEARVMDMKGKRDAKNSSALNKVLTKRKSSQR